jgi:hypothetical protein
MITGYITPIDWIPNPNFVNEPPDYEYLAYRLSGDVKTGRAVWAIEPVVDSPTVTIENLLLGVDYEVIDISGDLNRYGFERNLYPHSTINEVEDIIAADKEFVTNELL